MVSKSLADLDCMHGKKETTAAKEVLRIILRLSRKLHLPITSILSILHLTLIKFYHAKIFYNHPHPFISSLFSPFVCTMGEVFLKIETGAALSGK